MHKSRLSLIAVSAFILSLIPAATVQAGCADGRCSADEWKSVAKLEFSALSGVTQRLNYKFTPTRSSGATLIMDLYKKEGKGKNASWVRVTKIAKYRSATKKNLKIKPLKPGEYALVFYGSAFRYDTKLEREVKSSGSDSGATRKVVASASGKI